MQVEVLTRKLRGLVAALLVAGVLAGCAEPEEAGEPAGEEPFQDGVVEQEPVTPMEPTPMEPTPATPAEPTPTEPTPVEPTPATPTEPAPTTPRAQEPVGDEAQNVEEVVVIGGAVYECDTFFEVDVAEGRCDEYQLTGADPAAFADAPRAQAANDVAVVNGVTYACDESIQLTGGPCEEFVLPGTLE